MSKFFGQVKTSFREDIEPNEILLDRLAKRKEEEFGLSEKKFETPLFKRVIEGLFVFSVLVLFLLFAKTFQLQVVKNKDFLAQAEANKFIYYKIRAERGVIYDQNLNQLVFNEPSFDLILEKNKLPSSESERSAVLTEVANILKTNPEELKGKVEGSKDFQALISENLDNPTMIILETKIKDLPGFKVENNTRRQYIDGEVFSQIMGYNGKITSEELANDSELYSIFYYVGRAGIEKTYEEVLRKNSGETQIERDAKGNIISRETISLPEPGKSLVLWLDSDLQKKITETLANELKAVGSLHGSAVALDPQTGGVLAMVSLPSFDNNAFSQGDAEEIGKILSDKKEPLFNRVVSGQFPTGSTIKPLIAASALEEKIISSEKKIYSPGFIEVPNRYDPEIIYQRLDQAPHDWYDMRKAIAFSSNVYFYTVGGGYKDQRGLGPTKIKKYLELFGWGEKTNIDFPSESRGLIPSPAWKEEVKKEGWWDGDTYNLSIGQGNLLTTPLQVATAFLPLANGGRLLQPQVVKEII
ncbi:MAG: penicillin-binding transpeptidase domain-containing protein, partial [bacterium]|nr:penicillin-binding transpeptidase domain-containing protein [bacterium]